MWVLQLCVTSVVMFLMSVWPNLDTFLVIIPSNITNTLAIFLQLHMLILAHSAGLFLLFAWCLWKAIFSANTLVKHLHTQTHVNVNNSLFQVVQGTNMAALHIIKNLVCNTAPWWRQTEDFSLTLHTGAAAASIHCKGAVHFPWFVHVKLLHMEREPWVLVSSFWNSLRYCHSEGKGAGSLIRLLSRLHIEGESSEWVSGSDKHF